MEEDLKNPKKFIDNTILKRLNQYKTHYDKKAYSLAYQELEKALYLNSDHKEAHQLACNVAQKMADISLAISHLNQSLIIQFTKEEDNLLAELILQKGLLTIQQGGLDVVAGIIRTKNKICNLTQGFYKAQAYLLGNRKLEALSEINALIEENNTNVEAHILKGKTLWSLENISEGNECFWVAKELDHEHPEIKEFISYITPKINACIEDASKEIVLGNNQKSFYYLKKGLDMHKDNFDLKILKSFLNRKIRNYEEAMQDLENLKIHVEGLNSLSEEQKIERKEKIQQNLALTYNEMGMFLYKRGEYEDALNLFKVANKYKENDAGIITNIADCYLMKEEMMASNKLYTQAMKLVSALPQKDELRQKVHARYAYLLQMRAKYFFNERDYQEAFNSIKESLTYHLTRDKLHLKAQILLQLRQPEKAVEVYNEVLKRDPEDYVALQFLNQFYKSK